MIDNQDFILDTLGWVQDGPFIKTDDGKIMASCPDEETAWILMRSVNLARGVIGIFGGFGEAQ